MAQDSTERTVQKAEKSAASQVTLLGKDTVVIEFRIDDLLRQLRVDLDRIRAVAACGGCDACSK